MDEFAKLNGFEDWAEMSQLVSYADISTPEKLARFNNWKLNDGSKAGLLLLNLRNSTATTALRD